MAMHLVERNVFRLVLGDLDSPFGIDDHSYALDNDLMLRAVQMLLQAFAGLGNDLDGLDLEVAAIVDVFEPALGPMHFTKNRMRFTVGCHELIDGIAANLTGDNER